MREIPAPVKSLNRMINLVNHNQNDNGLLPNNNKTENNHFSCLKIKSS